MAFTFIRTLQWAGSLRKWAAVKRNTLISLHSINKAFTFAVNLERKFANEDLILNNVC